MDKKKVSTVLEEVALLLELKGDNPFKVRAYSHAARAIETLEGDLEVLIREARLTEIKGIGEALAQHIVELAATGRLGRHYRRFRKDRHSHPYRLDIDWRLCKYAKEKGVRIAINPDAHKETGLKDTFYGVGIGRKGWLEPGDILNAMDLGEMKAFLERRKPA